MTVAEAAITPSRRIVLFILPAHRVDLALTEILQTNEGLDKSASLLVCVSTR
ncbi:hypothetical protein ACH35V_07035 [Actinomadura sp. 1N219]|uniref:hypothetical protein n=1 Tax=Actinomadura sp. 1N219 TaxID=3375152 RepID=UPI0037BB90B1